MMVMGSVFILWWYTLICVQHIDSNQSASNYDNLSMQYKYVLRQFHFIDVWQSSRPASFSPAGLTLWPNWLERWFATLSRLSTQVRIPVRSSVPGRYRCNWFRPAAVHKKCIKINNAFNICLNICIMMREYYHDMSMFISWIVRWHWVSRKLITDHAKTDNSLQTLSSLQTCCLLIT